MLGKNGELGNQMFQYAALYSLGKKTDTKCVIPSCFLMDTDSKRPGGRSDVNEIELYTAFKNLTLEKMHPKEIVSKIPELVQFDESQNFTYNKNLFSVKPPMNVNGYFQSPQYFDDFSEDIRKEFVFEDSLKSRMTQKLQSYKKNFNASKICAVHFRRSDYSGKSHYHTNLEWETYYLPALRAISNRFSDISFLVFSDDIPWCKQNLPDLFMYSDCTDQYEDLCLMSLCDAHIIANSSFSWWGSYLANREHVVAPYRWFAEEGPARWDTIYCPHWIVI